jgi:hypothetical protein
VRMVLSINDAHDDVEGLEALADEFMRPEHSFDPNNNEDVSNLLQALFEDSPERFMQEFAPDLDVIDVTDQ